MLVNKTTELTERLFSSDKTRGKYKPKEYGPFYGNEKKKLYIWDRTVTIRIGIHYDITAVKYFMGVSAKIIPTRVYNNILWNDTNR